MLSSIYLMLLGLLIGIAAVCLVVWIGNKIMSPTGE